MGETRQSHRACRRCARCRGRGLHCSVGPRTQSGWLDGMRKASVRWTANAAAPSARLQLPAIAGDPADGRPGIDSRRSRLDSGRAGIWVRCARDQGGAAAGRPAVARRCDSSGLRPRRSLSPKRNCRRDEAQTALRSTSATRSLGGTTFVADTARSQNRFTPPSGEARRRQGRIQQWPCPRPNGPLPPQAGVFSGDGEAGGGKTGNDGADVPRAGLMEGA
jgi:hypothetical protein